eukprot:COSAG02_NODE_2481_length_8726_cov_65.689231_5_plen_90_part_00
MALVADAPVLGRPPRARDLLPLYRIILLHAIGTIARAPRASRVYMYVHSRRDVGGGVHIRKAHDSSQNPGQTHAEIEKIAAGNSSLHSQ